MFFNNPDSVMNSRIKLRDALLQLNSMVKSHLDRIQVEHVLCML